MSRYVRYPAITWQSPVADAASLPVDASAGDARVTLDNNSIFVYGLDNIWHEVSGGGGGGGDSFYIMQTPLGTSPTATSATDILTWDSSDGLVDITGDAVTDTISLSLNLSGFPTASTLDTGFLTSADWSTFNSKQGALTLGDLTTSTTGVNVTGGVGAVVGAGTALNINTASGAQPGLLSSADWTTFNSKQAALTLGNFTSPTTGVSVTGGTGAVVGAGGVALSIQTATALQPGLLSAADFVTFNGKQASGNYITALTGDATASGPGSVALTLATVNGAPGSFGSATNTLIATVNGKGLITSLSATPIAIAQSQVTNLTVDLGLKAPLASPNFTTQVTFGNYFMNPSEVNDGNSGVADTIDWGTGSAHLSTLTGNVLYTLSNPVAGGAYVLRILTGTGGFTVSWPAAVKWPGNTAPVITPTAGRMDLVNFYYDGTNYWGSISQNYTP